MKKLVGILCNVLIKVASFIFLVDFVILDCEVDFKVPIMFRRLFLMTRWALVDIEIGKIKFLLINGLLLIYVNP